MGDGLLPYSVVRWLLKKYIFIISNFDYSIGHYDV